MSVLVALGSTGCAKHELDRHEAADAGLEPMGGAVWRHRYVAEDGSQREALLAARGASALLIDPPNDAAEIRRLVEVVTDDLDATVVGVVLTRAVDPEALADVPRSATLYVEGGRAAFDPPGRRVLPLDREGRDLAGLRFASTDLEGRTAVWLPDAGIVFADGQVLVPASTATSPGQATPGKRADG